MAYSILNGVGAAVRAAIEAALNDLDSKTVKNNASNTITGQTQVHEHAAPVKRTKNTDAGTDQKYWSIETSGSDLLDVTHSDDLLSFFIFARTYRSALTPSKKKYFIPLDVDSLQVGGTEVISASREYATEFIHGSTRTRMPAAAFDGSQKHALRYGADDTDVLQTIVRIAANNYLLTNRGPFAIQDSSSTETVRIGNDGKMTKGTVPLARARKSVVNGATTGSVILTTSFTDIIWLSMGTVETGDYIDLLAYVQAAKGGTQGYTTLYITMTGTAAVEMLGQAISTVRIIDAQLMGGSEAYYGFPRIPLKVTTGGSLTLKLQGISGGSNSTINAGNGRIEAHLYQGA